MEEETYYESVPVIYPPDGYYKGGNFINKLPTAKAGGFCYHQPMLKNLSLTRSPAMVDAPIFY